MVVDKLKIELRIGGHYKNRCGDEVIIVGEIPESSDYWEAGYSFTDMNGLSYTNNGRYNKSTETSRDLIHECDLSNDHVLVSDK